LTDRAEILEAVDHALANLHLGILPDAVERQKVDFKEEPGRRGAGGRLLAGETRNTQAANQLADEVAALANTLGGGALIVGVENKTGELFGTQLDPEWLRHQIYRTDPLMWYLQVDLAVGLLKTTF